ncbi:MAG: crossover junction endodeoxyribonuclease RuvC, partial [Candidatus Tectimicrobiota bacterium]
GRRLTPIAWGVVRGSARAPLAERLKAMSDGLREAIATYHPTVVAIEDTFYARNVKAALALGQARGVALVEAAAAGLEVVTYPARTIKLALVGYGAADKDQVQAMVARLLGLEEPPQPPDAADALAVAICHLHTSTTEAILRAAH